ncbi:muscle LIM protein Mlp84B isoform X3 [Octopus vulgaris]|uniref:Muscle LIM protein Mlp84B isoform X3 n=2 Tax=Octopus vulgaris TaxID=6645 RepID=A0AA36FL80_OCTVU|nr:muscle LIM protein Mlp84B isoform X3 [Octopus vulgaris]
MAPALYRQRIRVSIMSQKCPRCDKAVYFAEEVRALGKKWHKLCLKCAKCNNLLDSTTCTDHDNEVFCRACYAKHFGPKGYGFAGGASGLSMDTGDPAEVTRKNVSHLAEAHAAPILSTNGTATAKPRWGSSDMCPRCNKAVYMAEKVIGAGKLATTNSSDQRAMVLALP